MEKVFYWISTPIDQLMTGGGLQMSELSKLVSAEVVEEQIQQFIFSSDI